MSTRATYEFKGKKWIPTITMYIHCDGYPEYACEYFYEALKIESKGSFADAFHRANNGAEFTLSHDAHGDTEYQYDIDGENIKAYKIYDWSKKEIGNTHEGFYLFFDGTVVDFIKKYKEDHDIVSVNYYDNTFELPLDAAKRFISNSYNYIDRWVDDGQYIGNLSSSLSVCLKNIHLFGDLEKLRIEKCRILCINAYPHMKEYSIPVN